MYSNLSPPVNCKFTTDSGHGKKKLNYIRWSAFPVINIEVKGKIIFYQNYFKNQKNVVLSVFVVEFLPGVVYEKISRFTTIARPVVDLPVRWSYCYMGTTICKISS